MYGEHERLLCAILEFFGRIHRPGAEQRRLKRYRGPLEIEVVPAGREFLWRSEVLGVPGMLDGRSHVVSKEGAKTERSIRKAETQM